MRRILAVLAVCTASLFAWNPDEQPNVNSRYVVESVKVSGKRSSRLSVSTRNEVENVVGQKLDHSLLERLAIRIKKEVRVDKVGIHVARGSYPEQVAVEFALEGGRGQDFDIDIPKGVYHSRQGWSGGVDFNTQIGDNRFSGGLISDGDALLERFSGVRARYERKSLGTDRVRFGLALDSFDSEWNSSTNQAALRSHFSPDLYRTRTHVEPTVTFVVTEPLTVTVGVSYDHLGAPAQGASDATAAATTGTVRFHKAWEYGAKQELDALYSLRAASGLMGGDFAYSRHAWTVSYRMGYGHNSLAVDFLAGRIVGTAPLFEKFVLGNASTLRGWNKFDLDPLGGDRVVHGSVGYSYRGLQVFYDTGAIWEKQNEPDQKQSAGVGFGRAGKDGFMVAAAFPLRSGHIEPVFILGFNF